MTASQKHIDCNALFRGTDITAAEKAPNEETDHVHARVKHVVAEHKEVEQIDVPGLLPRRS